MQPGIPDIAYVAIVCGGLLGVALYVCIDQLWKATRRRRRPVSDRPGDTLTSLAASTGVYTDQRLPLRAASPGAPLTDREQALFNAIEANYQRTARRTP